MNFPAPDGEDQCKLAKSAGAIVAERFTYRKTNFMWVDGSLGLELQSTKSAEDRQRSSGETATIRRGEKRRPAGAAGDPTSEVEAWLRSR
jgi:hypothetical protein